MAALETAEIGSTGLRVTRLGMGGATLGGFPSPMDADTAGQIVEHAYELGIRYFDTAPMYGVGASERHLGRVLGQIPRDDFALSTKVGRVLNPGPDGNLEALFDFSRDGVMRSVEESLERLGLDRVDIALIHDPDDHYEQAIGEAYPALADLRSQGVVKAIGAGMNQWETLARFARDGDFDCFLMAGRYTLLEQLSLAEFMPLCEEKGISVIVGGPYNSGVLASDLSSETTYNYLKVTPEILDQARRIKAVCDRHGVPLKAAALQFCLAHPAVAAIIPGPRAPSEVEENVAMAASPIPADLWSELRSDGLIAESAPTPG